MFRYPAAMVGPPKTLQDLRLVEAAVRITCRVCGHVALVDRELMLRERWRHRMSCEWDAVRANNWCRKKGCGSRDVRVDGVPFAQNTEELRQRRAVSIRANLAVSILQRCAYKASGPAPMPEAVKLALRVVHPLIGRQDLLEQFWRAWAESTGLVHETPHRPLVGIIDALIDAGVPINAEFRGGSHKHS